MRTPIGSFGEHCLPFVQMIWRHMPCVLDGTLPQPGPHDNWRCADGLCQSGGRQPKCRAHGQPARGVAPRSPARRSTACVLQGLAASVHASRMLHMGDAQVVLAGGVEHMTRGPWVLSKRPSRLAVTWNCTTPALAGGSSIHVWMRFTEPKAWANGREPRGFAPHQPRRPDAFAYRSQMKAAAAQNEGRLAEELVSVSIPQRKKDPISFEADEFIKPGTSPEVLAKLRPAFRKEGGSVTAGNASGLNDGSRAVVGQRRRVEITKPETLARMLLCRRGVPPRIMGIGLWRPPTARLPARALALTTSM